METFLAKFKLFPCLKKIIMKNEAPGDKINQNITGTYFWSRL